MRKIRRLDFKKENKKTGKVENIGYIEVKNEGESEENKNISLYFYGDIGSAQWETSRSEENKCPDDVINFFNAIDSNKDVDIYFNSGGGNAFAGLAIHNIIKRHNGKTTAYIDGLAASIASVIVCACDEVVAYNGSQLMVHKPMACIRGNSNDLKNGIDLLDKVEESIVDVYMTKVKDGVERSTIEELVNNETWMTTSDMQNYFDFKVDNSIQSVSACSSTYFDIYEHKPKALEEDIKLEKAVNKILDKFESQRKLRGIDNIDIDAQKQEILKDLDLFGIDL